MYPITCYNQDIKELLNKFHLHSHNKGLEYHAFKVGWYNECVGKSFVLPYEKDIVAFVIISAPQMFEQLLLPFILKRDIDAEGRDSVDACFTQHLMSLKEEQKPQYDIDIIHDFELTPTRRPKVLVQTAAHVAGAAYFYQRCDVRNDPWDQKKINGVCIHPKYGGWFAMRGVIIVKNLICPQLHRKLAVDCVPTNEKRIELLERFNFRWRDMTFRDIIPVEASYSPLQKLYFGTMPAERRQMLKEWLIKYSF